MKKEGKTEITIPQLKSLYNYLPTFKKSKFGHLNMSLGELAGWCDKNSNTPDPDLLDEAFIANHEIFDIDDNTNPNDVPDSYEKGDVFRIFITTRRLIEFSNNFKTVLQTDGTYKLLWQGFPVLLIGSSDAQRVFHAVGISVVSRERTNDYAFLFKSLQIARAKLNLEPLPLTLNLMADAAQAITNGYRKAGFTGIRGMCWFHVTKALKSRLAKLKDQVAVEIRQDIHFLQLSQNPKIFNGGYATFIEKWSNCIEPEDSESYFAVASEPVINFLEYFDHEWYVSYPNWFEGYSDPNNVAAPSTNNGNEGVNGRIKIEDTFREQLSMGEFCVVSFKMISKWSKWADSSNSKSKPFKTLPKPSLTVWTNAFLWNKSGIDIVSLSSELNHYYAKSGDSDFRHSFTIRYSISVVM